LLNGQSLLYRRPATDGTRRMRRMSGDHEQTARLRRG
jgi:hypothetical protein